MTACALPSRVELDDDLRRSLETLAAARPSDVDEAVALLRKIALLPDDLPASPGEWTGHQVRLVAATVDLRGDMHRARIRAAAPGASR